MKTTAKEQFHFYTRLNLTVMTGLSAKDIKELYENLKTVPESVIYHHTHHFLQQHQHLVPEPTNDFAYWVTHMLQDEKLGEKCAAIDTIRFNNLESLRQALLSVIESHMKGYRLNRQVPEGKEFHFMRAIRFSIPTPYKANNLWEFVDCLKKVSGSSLYLHMFESRLKHPLGINDFSDWLENQLGEKFLARQIANLDPYTHTMEGLRSRIVNLVETKMREVSHVNA